ncbi:MAG: hypothetical protein J5J00_03525 [Deltaproteobacteria bacterium]|nr:hypothetical protein [Deltaproteobacteria bacterium]
MKKLPYPRVLKAAAIFSALFTGHLYLQALTPFFLLESDPYLHIKLASLAAENGVMQSFPWTQFSIWRDAFCDKDFLFHFLLIPFTIGDLMSGAKLATAFFSALAGTCLYAALLACRIRWAVLYVIALYASGIPFAVRLVTLRTYLWSLTCLIACVVLILRRRYFLLCVTSSVFFLSYSAFPILFAVAGAAALSESLISKRLNLKAPVAVLVGFAAAFILHPQRENCIQTLYVQNITVLKAAVSGVHIIPTVTELLSIAPTEFLQSFWFVILLQIVSVIAWLRRRESRTEESCFLGITCGGFLTASLVWHRFLEYWVPFGLWWSASVIKYAALPHSKLKLLAGFLIPLGAASLGIHLKQLHGYLLHLPPQPALAAGSWMSTHLAEGELVFECDPKETSRLLFKNQKNHYLFLSDPNFFYQFDAELFAVWKKVVRGESKDPAREICSSFGAHLVYINHRCNRLADKLRSSAKTIYKTPYDGVVELNCPDR